MILDGYLTVSEAACLLGISPQTIYKRIVNGEIPFITIPYQSRFRDTITLLSLDTVRSINLRKGGQSA